MIKSKIYYFRSLHSIACSLVKTFINLSLELTKLLQYLLNVVINEMAINLNIFGPLMKYWMRHVHMLDY